MVKIEKEIRFIDLFGGVGGFRLGLQRANNNQYARFCKESKQEKCTQRRERAIDEQGKMLHCGNTPSFRCVGYYEIDKFAVKTYNKNFGEHQEPTDITKVKSSDIPEHDLICAGFPCQSFSVAGKRGGFNDTRGTLFYEIARIARDKRPSTLFLENVKGLLSHDKGATFATILQTLDELGYDAEWQVLNSKDWGVPQNRERVFIIGRARGSGGREVFPILKSSEKPDTTPGEARSTGTRGFNYPANTIAQRDYKGGNQVILHNVYGGFKEGIREFTDYSPTIRTPKGGGHLPLVKAVLTPNRPEKRQNGRRFKENGEPMFTLTGQDVHGVANETSIRRLTPVECERLQSFPDDWTAGVSDTQRYKQMGNAVTVNVIRRIGEELLRSVVSKNV